MYRNTSPWYILRFNAQSILCSLEFYFYSGRTQWQLGSLSHAINAEASGYNPLPEFPEEAPDPSARNVEVGWVM